jgi:hypothetical protein
MALALFDRVQETTTTTGTGSVTLGGAVPGFQSFAVVGNGNTCYYTIVDGTAWEVGIGTYSTSGPTLARTTVLSNSSGNTSPITLAAGTKTIFLTYPAEKSVNLDVSGNVSPLGTVSSGVWQGSTVGVAYGGTGVTTSSGANSVMLRDANQNVSINRLNQSSTAITAAGGTTTLTAASTFSQILNGTGGQTFKLPDATTLTNTTTFEFNNNATGTLTITDYANATIGTISSGGAAAIALLSNGTVGGTWDVHAYIPENVTWGTNSLVLGSTVITGGTWNGGTIATGYGGTGLTSYTSGGAVYANSSSTLTSGTLPVTAGGTGATTAAGAQSSLNVPSTTGSGASGTWGINVTGSSGSTTGNAATATILKAINATSTGVSNWNPGGLTYQAWGQYFINSAISADSGDITIWMRPSQYSGGGTELNMYIDGDYYSGTGAYKVLNAGNYSSYALPLTGGNLTGRISWGTSLPNAKKIIGIYETGNLWTGVGMAATTASPIIAGDGNVSTLLDIGYYSLDGAYTWTSSVQINKTSITVGGNTVLTAANYNSYAPTLTGTGATGTWAINISGNAATATSASSSTTASSAVTLFGSSQLYISPTNLNTFNSGYGNAADGSDIWLNYRGYNDGFSYYRNFNVGNGKGTAYIWGDGVNQRMSIGKGQYASYTLDVAGIIYTNTSSRAPVFYDSDNTGYYMDPSSSGNVQGNWEFSATNNSSTTYSEAAIELRESNQGGSGAYLPPRLAFHWGGVVASQIGIESDGRIKIINNPGTSYENFIANITYGSASVRGPIFYDSDNTGYYVDPASTSSLNNVNANGQLTGGYSVGRPSSLNGSNWAARIGANDVYLVMNSLDGTASYASAIQSMRTSDSASFPLFLNPNGGNVGINTPTAASAQLHVRASSPSGVGGVPSGVTMISDSSTDNYLLFRNGADNGTYGGIAFQDNNIGGYVMFGNAGGGGDQLWIAGYGGGSLQYGTASSINPAARTTTAYWNSTGFTVSSGSFYAPIFFDTQDTAYYVDPNGYSRTLFNSVYVGNEAPGAANSSSDGLVLRGNYNSNTWAHKFHKYDNGSGVPLYLSTTVGAGAWSARQGWGNGLNYTSQVFGSFAADDALYSPIFYDKDNTGYYLNPNGVSQVSGSYFYFGSHGQIYDDGNFHIDGRGSPVWINSLSNEAVFLNAQTSGYTVMGNSARSPIFYDYNDTSYYVDPNSTGNSVYCAGTGFFGGSGGNDKGIGLNSGSGASDYSRIRFYENGSNTQTIHCFSAAWQGTSFLGGSAGAINITGTNGVTFGAWPTPDVAIASGGGMYVRGNIYMAYSTTYSFGTNYWAGTGGYPGYQYAGGNTRFGFSGTAGYVDVYTDGNYYGGIDLYGANRLVPLFDANQGGGALYSSIVYDTNNTAYNCDPASRSALNQATFAGGLAFSGAFVLSGSGATLDNSTGARMTESYGAYWNFSNSATWHHQILNGSSLVGISAGGGNYGGGNILASGNITAYYSDERLKTKITTIESALDKVKSLEGFIYVENDLARSLGYTNAKEQAGVSAQRVQAVLPQAVSLAPVDMQGVPETGDIISKSGENYLTVDYSRLVPLLIEAIKELSAQVDELKKGS